MLHCLRWDGAHKNTIIREEKSVEKFSYPRLPTHAVKIVKSVDERICQIDGSRTNDVGDHQLFLKHCTTEGHTVQAQIYAVQL